MGGGFSIVFFLGDAFLNPPPVIPTKSQAKLRPLPQTVGPLPQTVGPLPQPVGVGSPGGHVRQHRCGGALAVVATPRASGAAAAGSVAAVSRSGTCGRLGGVLFFRTRDLLLGWVGLGES